MPGPGKPFEQGQSGNPGGKARMTPEMREAIDNSRAASPEMVGVLLTIARDGNDENARIKAANSVLDRALGKPVQSLEGTDDGPAIRVNLGPTIMIPPESAD